MKCILVLPLTGVEFKVTSGEDFWGQILNSAPGRGVWNPDSGLYPKVTLFVTQMTYTPLQNIKFIQSTEMLRRPIPLRLKHKAKIQTQHTKTT